MVCSSNNFVSIREGISFSLLKQEIESIDMTQCVISFLFYLLLCVDVSIDLVSFLASVI